MKYWALQDAGDPAPYAVIAVSDDGLPRRFVPGVGLVDWPGAGMWIYNGEPGAKPISETAARAYMQAGIGPLTAAVVASQRGQAPTIPVSGVITRKLSTGKHFVAAPPGKITKAEAERMGGVLFDAIATERAQVARGE